MLELHLFRVRSFAVACAGVGIFSLGFYALLLSNILFLTGVWHYSILKAGFAVTPGPLMAAVVERGGGPDRRPLRLAASSRSPAGCCSRPGCAVLRARRWDASPPT